MQLSQQDYLLCINRMIEERLSPLASKDLFSDAEGYLAQASRHLCVSAHAKRVRPLVCLYYSGLFAEEFHEDLVNIAVSAEFIHAASLLHDDIIDDAERRRGIDSVNYRFGNKTAVLAGDYLLSEAFNLLLPFERVLIDKAISVVREMTKAAIAELNIRGDFSISPHHLKSIAVGKTGLLFSWCGFATAMLYKRPEITDILWSLGKHIGIIFQLADDIKDFDGDNALKDICRDMRNLDPSMPIILAIQEHQEIKQEFDILVTHSERSSEQINNLIKMIKASASIENTRLMMQKEIAEAQNLVEKLPCSKGKNHLEAFINALGLPAT